jgi:hypothetical protein
LGAIIFFEHHTTRFFDTSGGLVKDSISVEFGTITKKIPSNAFGSNLPKRTPFLRKKHLQPKTRKYLMLGLLSVSISWSHVQAFAEEELV